MRSVLDVYYLEILIDLWFLKFPNRIAERKQFPTSFVSKDFSRPDGSSLPGLGQLYTNSGLNEVLGTPLLPYALPLPFFSLELETAPAFGLAPSLLSSFWVLHKESGYLSIFILKLELDLDLMCSLIKKFFQFVNK